MTANASSEARVCVIGAGPSGLATAKNLIQAGLRNCVVFEQSSDLGGNWAAADETGHSSVYETARAISSKRLSQFEDFPMPRPYPDYPSRRQLLEYFRAYARQFGVEGVIRFRTRVAQVDKAAARRWRVRLAGGETEEFTHVFVCNGHHWKPRMPNIPGRREGRLLHSHDYKTSRGFENQRVLIIGGGNSGCDIAVEISRVSAAAALSLRRGYHVVPRTLLGVPSDVALSALRWLPKRAVQALSEAALRAAVGRPTDYGLPAPDHRILESHPIVNSEILARIRRGKIKVVGPVERFEGRNAAFADGAVKAYDAVIACTGYEIRFPFFDESFINFAEGDVPLYLRMFHPDHADLFFIGLVQPIGCIWPLSDLQAKLAANLIQGRAVLPNDLAAKAAAEARSIARDFVPSPRHRIEVNYHAYRRRLLSLIPRSAPRWGEAPPEGRGAANGRRRP